MKNRFILFFIVLIFSGCFATTNIIEKFPVYAGLYVQGLEKGVVETDCENNTVSVMYADKQTDRTIKVLYDVPCVDEVVNLASIKPERFNKLIVWVGDDYVNEQEPELIYRRKQD